ncbi:MAG: transglycosylase SLT domain-containing protein [Myxococcota bacterium]
MTRALLFAVLLPFGLLAFRCGQEGAPRAEAQRTEPAAPTPSPPRRLDPRVAAPGEALLQARAGNFDGVSGPDRVLAHWFEGTSGLEALVQADHALAPLARLRLAEASLSESPEAAQRWLAGVPDGIRQRRRDRLRALAVAAGENPSAAVAALRAAVDAHAASSAAAAVALPLADLLLAEAETQDAEAARTLQLEALTLLDRVAVHGPRTTAGQDAERRATDLRRRLDAPRRSLADEITRASGLRRMAAREAAYGWLLRRAGRRHERRCELLFAEADAVLRQRERARGAPMMEAVAAACEGDLQARARYRAGRAFTQVDEKRRARASYLALLDEAPDHRLADDALYRLALIAPNDEGEQAFFEQLVSRYPRGDMRGEAIFRLGLKAYDEGRFDAARTHFEQGVGVGESREDLHGRAAYWRAQTLAQLGSDPADALEALAVEHPLSYYGQLALMRLAERAPDRHEALLTRFTDSDVPELTFPWRADFDSPAMARALALLRVGDVGEARIELEALGLLGAGAETSDRWIAAALLAQAGAHADSTRLFRRQLTAFRRTLPVGAARAMWRLAYPKAFAPLIETHAQDAEVPATLVRAVAREESGFDPRAVSPASAYGLIQVLVPTARRHGRRLGRTINARTLREADTNLAVGTRFMHWLQNRYEDPRWIPPAYNAGHANLDRWRRRHRSMAFDRFVEAIPYDETRRYTRRVLQSYGVYAWLDEGRLPSLL